MLNAIPFQIPAELLARFAAGDLVRYGTILKDAATGRIVGHMQETGLAHSLLSHLVGGVPTPFSAVESIVNATVGIDTNMRVRKAVELMQSLQVLQIANLAVSAVGIGVTMAGFVYMHRRLNALDRKLDLVLQTVRDGFDEQRRSALRQQMSRTQGLMRRAQDAQRAANAAVEFREIAAAMSDQAAYFNGEVEFVIAAKGTMDAALFRELAQALMLCNSVHIDCRLRTDDLRHALSVSESVAADYQRLFDPLTPMDFAGLGLDEAMTTVAALRDISDAAASKPFLIDALRTRRIAGDEYLHALDQETDQPLLVLRTG